MTEPYYRDDHVTLYLGDCLETLEWLTADVLVTDPPYGTQFSAANPRGGYGRRQDATRAGAAPGEGFTIANDDGTKTRDTVLARWGTKPALVFGSPRMPEPPGQWSDRLVWDKRRPGMNGGPWRYRHESIFVSDGFIRRDNETLSILSARADQTDHIHAKPVGLMMSLIACAPAGTIADPFAGSGTTLLAARNLGRTAVGVELEERYCELIAHRLAHAQQCLDFGDSA